jgi:hypothetical protein
LGLPPPLRVSVPVNWAELAKEYTGTQYAQGAQILAGQDPSKRLPGRIVIRGGEVALGCRRSGIRAVELLPAFVTAEPARTAKLAAVFRGTADAAKEHPAVSSSTLKVLKSLPLSEKS